MNHDVGSELVLLRSLRVSSVHNVVRHQSDFGSDRQGVALVSQCFDSRYVSESIATVNSDDTVCATGVVHADNSFKFSLPLIVTC